MRSEGGGGGGKRMFCPPYTREEREGPSNSAEDRKNAASHKASSELGTLSVSVLRIQRCAGAGVTVMWACSSPFLLVCCVAATSVVGEEGEVGARGKGVEGVVICAPRRGRRPLDAAAPADAVPPPPPPPPAAAAAAAARTQAIPAPLMATETGAGGRVGKECRRAGRCRRSTESSG